MRVVRRTQPLLILLAAVAYGAADQYLGSRVALGGWSVAVSQMSAPWLAIAFLGGCRPDRRIHAVMLGAAVTLAAVAGYMLMMLSPLEGVAPGAIHWPAELRSQLHIILPALLTGPLFGWLGWRWRRDHALAPALLLAALFCLEPLARIAGHRQIYAHSPVWPLEALVGAALAVAAVATRRAPRRA